MMRHSEQLLARLALALGAFVLLAGAPRAQAPASYHAVSDRGTRAEPRLPSPGIAGSEFVDPAFGTAIRRVTDGGMRPGLPNRSFRTPSSTHLNAWSASGRYFYVVSTDGTIVPFAFDRDTGRASRIDPVPGGDGGLVLRFYTEPHFSYVRDGVLYGAASGGSLRTIDEFDFATGGYARLLDLDSLVPGLRGTYVGGIGSSAGPVERILTLFGGASQDRHFYLVLFDRANPANRRLLDTRASTLDGRATRTSLGFMLHAAALDRSGRYVTLYPAGADRAAPRSAAPSYVWDTSTDTITELPSVAARSNGHDAYGYGVRVNQDCCTATPWDAAQWQVRSLASPLVTEDVVRDVLLPKQVYLADHPSWHNARADRSTPFITALYRFGDNQVEWRAWDDEILAVGRGDVWRLAHHRSDVRHDGDPGRIAFWYTPRPNVSQDGRWVLFTSNWEKTLGTDPGGASGEAARQDVFLLRLPASSDDAGDGERQDDAAIALPDATLRRLYSIRLPSDGAARRASWTLAAGALPPGLSLGTTAGRIVGIPRQPGTWVFSLRLQSGASSSVRRFVVTVRPAAAPPPG